MTEPMAFTVALTGNEIVRLSHDGRVTISPEATREELEYALTTTLLRAHAWYVASHSVAPSLSSPPPTTPPNFVQMLFDFGEQERVFRAYRNEYHAGNVELQIKDAIRDHLNAFVGFLTRRFAEYQSVTQHTSPVSSVTDPEPPSPPATPRTTDPICDICEKPRSQHDTASSGYPMCHIMPVFRARRSSGEGTTTDALHLVTMELRDLRARVAGMVSYNFPGMVLADAPAGGRWLYREVVLEYFDTALNSVAEWEAKTRSPEPGT
jgi:hypothetical protein